MSLKSAARGAAACLRALIQTLASLKLAVCLIIVLGMVIAVATFLETVHGRAYSQWFVYHSSWFMGLLTLLGASVFSAAYVRLPWKRHQSGFVITHAGLLVLLAGAIVSYQGGFEGQITLLEGASTNQLTLNDRSQITAYWVDRPHDRPYVFTFDSGPVDWRPGVTLDVGEVDGLSARILRYYRRSQRAENWVADEAGRGGPMIRFKLEGSHVDACVENFLVDADYGGEVFVGPIAIRLQRTISEAMLADFLNPPDIDLGENGVLTIYHGNKVERLSVDDHVGQAVAIDDRGSKVELLQYLSNAKLDASGQFKSVGEDIRNPFVELKIQLPTDDEPYRQVAFAKSPLLNFDGVYERDCPIRFVYRHPKVAPTAAVEFLQSSGGKLYSRTVENGTTSSQGEVSPGSQIKLPGGFTFTVSEYVPHARREVFFRAPEYSENDERANDSPAAKFEIAIEGETQTLWLQRNDPEFGVGAIELRDGPLQLHFSTAQIPLGFSIDLIDFKRETNPGNAGNAAFSSRVRVKDESQGIGEERLISMNQPLSHHGVRIYQSSYRDAGHGKDASILSVAYDPGRPLKYAGGLMVCVGITTMFYMRAYFFKPTTQVGAGLSSTTENLSNSQAMKAA
jgi:hypothetical protein